MFEFLKRKKECTVPPPGWRCTRGAGHEPPCAAVPAAPQVVEHNQIHLTGSELERAVQRELLRGDPTWELGQMQPLLSILWAHGFTVLLQTYTSGRTMVAIRPGDIVSKDDSFVSEDSEIAPCVALARAALAAARTWPEVMQ